MRERRTGWRNEGEKIQTDGGKQKKDVSVVKEVWEGRKLAEGEVRSKR